MDPMFRKEAENVMDPVFKAADKGNIISLQELVAVKPNTIYSTTKLEKNTALHIAASEGHTLFVHHFLLHAGMNMELMVSQNNHGDTPLHLAVRAGHLEVVEHLTKYSVWAREIGANLKEPTIMANTKGNTPIHVALFQQQLDIALKLLEVNPRCAHALNVEMESPLYIAAREGHLHVVKKIADQVSTAYVSSIGTSLTAFHKAVLDDNIRILEILLNNIVELVELTDSLGDNALHYAARHNRADMVSMLQNSSPTLAYKKNFEQHTPLHMAAKYGSVEAARELLKQCPDTVEVVDSDVNIVDMVELTDSSGNNALHYAAWHNVVCVVSMLHHRNSTLAYKKNVDQHTPFHMAAKYGSVDAARELLKLCPVTVGMVDLDGRNAFHISIINNKLSVLEFLLKYELPEEIMNKQDNDGNTPLHHAAKLHQGPAILWLLNNPRIYSFVINKDGHTAWGYQILLDLMAEVLSNAIDKGDMPSLVNLLASNPEMIYSVTPTRGHTALHLAALKGKDWFIHHVLLYTNRNVGFIISENSDGDTPLRLAVREGHLEVVHHLIRYMTWAREIEPNLKLKEPLIMRNKAGNNLLHEAVIHDRYEVAVSLLDCAKEVAWMAAGEFIKEYHEYTGDVVSTYDALLVIRNEDGDTPLHLAVKAGSSLFVDMLINCAKVMNQELTTHDIKGAIIMGNNKGNTPLHEAVLVRKSDIALKLLEANPRCGHKLNAAMQSPLYIAGRDGLTHVVKKIADQGLSVTHVSTHGTALHQSVLGKNIRALEMLLNRYAELLELTDSSGNNVLHYAARSNDARMVSMLLNKNSTIAYKQNEELQTPLHVAANYGSMDAAKELLKQCPDVSEMVDIHGRNAFHIAVMNNKVNVLELLLKYVLPKEILNKQDIYGNTPLHHAAMISLVEPGLLLLRDRRVNTSLINNHGHTAFALSGRTGTLEMNADQMNLWNKLKKREPRRWKQQRVTTSPYAELNIGVYVIVATLMSMATFSAMLTMPGGYSQQLGTAIMGHHLAFKMFIVCNTLSVCSLNILVACFIWRWQDAEDAKLKVSMLVWGHRLIVFSGLGMTMSMLAAVYIAVAPASRWVAYVAIAIGASTPFLACLIRKSILPSNWWLVLHHGIWIEREGFCQEQEQEQAEDRNGV